MTEMSEERDALNLARSRFDAAKLAYDLAAKAADEAFGEKWYAWAIYEAAADDLAAANRRILHTIASGGSHG